MHTEKKNTQKELKKMKMKRKWKEKGREHRSSQWDSKRVHLRKKISTVSGGGPGPRVPPPLAAPLRGYSEYGVKISHVRIGKRSGP
jgi:hypothetical protein